MNAVSYSAKRLGIAYDKARDEEGQWVGGEGLIRREIRITVLHEIGHHFGLDEDDLEALGYE